MPPKKQARRLPEIPDDVWRMIIKFAVGSLHTFFRFLTINKRLRRALLHPVMLTHIDVRLREPSQLARLGLLGSRIRSLRFDCVSDESFDSILLPPTITDLNLACSNITEQGLAMAIRGLSSLTHLNLNNCNVEDFSVLANLPLVRLAVGGSNSEFWGAEDLLPTLPNLQELDMGCMCLCSDPFDRPGTESPCVQAISRLPNLHTLNLEGTDLHDREFMKLGPLAATLKFLSLAHTDITDKSASVLSGFSRLESLSVNGCHVSKRCLRAISKLRQLRVLHASDCQRMVQDDSLASLAVLSHLEELDISCNPVHRFEALYSLRHLRVLDVSACHQVCADVNGHLVFQRERDISDEAKRALAYHMPWLVIKSPSTLL